MKVYIIIAFAFFSSSPSFGAILIDEKVSASELSKGYELDSIVIELLKCQKEIVELKELQALEKSEIKNLFQLFTANLDSRENQFISIVGLIVALMAIVVTISIGYQVYNAVEMRKNISSISNAQKGNFEMMYEIRSAQQQLQEQQVRLTEDLKKVDERQTTISTQLKEASLSVLKTYIGLAVGCRDDGQFIESIRYLIMSINSSIMLEDSTAYNGSIAYLDTILQDLDSIDTVNKISLDAMKEQDKLLRNNMNYSIVKRRYENMMDKIMDKLKAKELV